MCQPFSILLEIQRHRTQVTDPSQIGKQIAIDPVGETGISLAEAVGAATGGETGASLAEAVGAATTPRDSAIAVAARKLAILVCIVFAFSLELCTRLVREIETRERSASSNS